MATVDHTEEEVGPNALPGCLAGVMARLAGWFLPSGLELLGHLNRTALTAVLHTFCIPVASQVLLHRISASLLSQTLAWDAMHS